MILQELVSRLGFQVDEKPLHKVEHALESIHGKLEFLAAVEIVKGVWELAERFAGMGENLETAAVSAGITATEFQKLAFAASQNAVGQDALSGALARMSRLLQKAKDGSAGAVGEFEKLGITPQQIEGFHNSEDALLAVQDAIKGIDDPIRRVAAAQAIFGRGAAPLVKWLAKGSEETKRLGASAEEMGAVLSDKGVENLANFEDAVSGAMQVVKTFGARIGATFAPVFTAAIHDVEHLWGANQKLIQQNLKKWAGDAAYAFGFITEVIRIGVVALTDFIKAHPKLSDAIAEVVATFAGFSLGVAVLKFLLGGTIKTIENLSGAASIAKPVLAGAFSASRVVLRSVIVLAGTLLERLGLLIVETFPALGEAIFSLGSKLLVLAANPMLLAWIVGIAGVVLAIQAAWAMLHGKSFWDTWIGQGINAILKYGGAAWSTVKKIFGMKGEGGVPQVQGAIDLPEVMSKTADLGASDSAMQQLLASVSGGNSNLAALQATGVPYANSAPMSPIMTPSQTVTLNAPITINAGGGNAQDIAREAQKAVKAALDQALRATQRDVQPIASH